MISFFNSSYYSQIYQFQYLGLQKANLFSSSEDMGNLTCQTVDFFSFILVNTPVKLFSLSVCFICFICVPILTYGIFWYDCNGPDKNRTFLNRLAVSLCYIVVEIFVIIQLTEAIRHIYGPMPKLFCHIKAVARPVYITQSLLYLDAITVTRYLFIFVLRNPAAFPDDFWIMFVNVWIRSACIIGNTAWALKNEHEVLNYYICTGEDPTEVFKNPLKVYGFVEAGSFLIHLFVFIRIQIFKHKRKNELAITQGCISKSQYLEEINALSLGAFLVNVFSITVFVLLFVSTMAMNRIKPSELEHYKSFIHVHYLVSLSLPGFLYIMIYYFQHFEMITFLWNNHPMLIKFHKKN